MEKIVKAPAKLNLTLDIVGRRADGYHNLRSVMQAVSLYDTVTLTENNSGEITVSCTNPEIPCNDSNIAVKCAKAFYEYTGSKCRGLHIHIDKEIPTQAGLAGGSADGAGVLFGLNEMYNKPLNSEDLEVVGGKVGADIPFCLRGGTCLAEGTGVDLTRLNPIANCYIVLVKPPVGISTAEAYSAVDKENFVSAYATDTMLNSLDSVKAVGENLSNDFEEALCIEELLALKREIANFEGAFGACMTGSGSTVFGIFGNESEANTCAEKLQEKYSEVFVVTPIDHGAEIVE